MSPGFTPRPSLSDAHAGRRVPDHARVAGVHAPAFVERRGRPTACATSRQVSPGFTPRPSLSAVEVGRDEPGVHQVSPGFTPRPSLSVPVRAGSGGVESRVAGVHAPAFVERSRDTAGCPGTTVRVAGVHAPAFVERSPPPATAPTPAAVSPGFTPRPSLSGRPHRPRRAGGPGVSPGFTPRPSLSAPAGLGSLGESVACRRGSRPGVKGNRKLHTTGN